MTRPRTPVAAAALGAAFILACVLQDRGIVIVDENVQNKHPVRFIEPTPVTNEAANGCLELLLGKKETTTAVCQPSDPATTLPQFLDSTLKDENGQFPYRFCSCDAQESDTIKLPAVTLFVEDRANDIDADEPIFAALQLDLRPDETEPQKTVEYIGYVDPNASLDASLIDYAPPRRPNTAAGRRLRELNLGFAEDPIDLCNGAGTTSLARGFHTLRVIVTDAPWYTPPPIKKGATAVQQVGVPDLTNGATYDTVTYIFHCDDKTDAHCSTQCQVPQ